MPLVPESAPPEPVDPGAASIVKSIADALADRRVAGDAIAIDLSPLRNLSRSSAAEFAAFTSRLAELLTHAGREHRMTFTIDPSATAPYRMLGTAYLMTADGFDQWEMYLSVSPSDRDWQVWAARSAVRAMRMPRAGQPQITTVVR